MTAPAKQLNGKQKRDYGTPEQRFWAKVQRTDDDACWIWKGKIGYGRYGRFSVGVRWGLAHRFSWSLANGRGVPPGMLVLHRCDNPPCVNPAHLYMGTQSDNMRDAVNRGRHPETRKRNCVRGHALEGANVKVIRKASTGRPYRYCRACARIRHNGRCQ